MLNQQHGKRETFPRGALFFVDRLSFLAERAKSSRLQLKPEQDFRLEVAR